MFESLTFYQFDGVDTCSVEKAAAYGQFVACYAHLFEERSACSDGIHPAAVLRCARVRCGANAQPYRLVRYVVVLERTAAACVRVVVTGEDNIRSA